MSEHTDTLTVVRGESAGLIRAEVLAAAQRSRLERAVYEAVTRLGCTVDAVSAETGLTPAEVRRIVDEGSPLDEDLAALAGMR